MFEYKYRDRFICYCFGGGNNNPPPAPPPPPTPEQTAFDKLQRDNQLRRESYLRSGLDPDKPIVTQIDTGSPGKVVLGQSTTVGQA